MALINVTQPEDAGEKVAALYSEIEKAFGFLPNALKIYSASPELLEQWWTSVAYYMNRPNMPYVPLLATVTMIISEEHHCEYCFGLNETMLIEMGGFNKQQLEVIRKDPSSAPFNSKDKALLLFAIAASRNPKSITQGDVDELRKLGWEDGEILEIVHYVGRNISTDLIFNTLKIDRDI